jgi:hypothetical protein
VKTFFSYCLVVKDEHVKIIRSNHHYHLWLWPEFSFVNLCSLWDGYLVIVCDMWWTIWSCLIVNNNLLYCIKKYVLITIFSTRLKLLKKDQNWNEINLHWCTIIKFMLAFSGLSPLFIGHKVNVIQINVTYKASNNVCNCWTRPNKNEPTLINFLLEKATNGPNKIFFGLYEQCRPIGTVLDSTQLQTGQIRFMMQTLCHNWHATSDYV